MPETKDRTGISLDIDIMDKIRSVAEAQRTTVSALINQILAEKLGMIRKVVKK